MSVPCDDIDTSVGCDWVFTGHTHLVFMMPSEVTGMLWPAIVTYLHLYSFFICACYLRLIGMHKMQNMFYNSIRDIG